MKVCLIIILFFLNQAISYAQPGLWTWINGDSTSFAPAQFGVPGVFDPSNHPFGGYEGCEWTDKQGNFWFWESRSFPGMANDLWKYSPSLNMWAFIKGSTLPNDSGYYGNQGISDPLNLPYSRGFGIASWTDTSGNLWMYGGANSAVDYVFNDLWMYNISTNNWTWIHGSNIPNLPPVYGIKGISSPTNTPGARSEVVCTWVDENNDLWLFGGLAPALVNEPFNDLWKYSIANNEWTWMKGDSITNAPGVYGTMGIEDSLNTPGARWAYSRWVDDNGNFWLFGGAKLQGQLFNDMWTYNPTSNNWTWMKGTNGFLTDSGNTGGICATDTVFNPTSRFESRSCWKDKIGNFWMFGGFAWTSPGLSQSIYLNDIWMFTVATNEWTLIWADSSINSPGNFGIKGLASPCNKPLGRLGSVCWYDSTLNSMFLLGGYHYIFPGSGGGQFRSAMWKYEMDTTCTVHICNPSSLGEVPEFENLSVYPNPFTNNTTIYFNATESELIYINIYELTGKLVINNSYESTNGTNKIELEVNGLDQGVYIMSIFSKSQLSTIKILKE